MSIHPRSFISFASVLLGRLLVDDAHHLSLDGLLLQHESILVPNEVGVLRVVAVLLHAALEEVDNVAVVGVLREAQASAVVHEFSEFFRLVLAQLVDRGLFLLLLDSGVLLGLRSARQTLPRE